MAEIVGIFATSHAPQLMMNPDQWHLINPPSWRKPLAEELQNVPHEVKWERWNRCRAAVDQIRQRLEELNPDTLIVLGDDQHENFIEDGEPPFTLFIGDQAEASVSLRYLDQTLDENRTTYTVDRALGEAVIDQLMDDGFDPAYSRKTRYAGGLGHAFARPLSLMTPKADHSVLPVMVNTYYPPAPSAKRCVEFGHALAKAIDQYPEARRVAILASGGLSHTRIDIALDEAFIKALETNNTKHFEKMAADDLVDGTSEIRNWIVAAAAADRPGTMLTYEPLPRIPEGGGCAMGFATW